MAGVRALAPTRHEKRSKRQQTVAQTVAIVSASGLMAIAAGAGGPVVASRQQQEAMAADSYRRGNGG